MYLQSGKRSKSCETECIIWHWLSSTILHQRMKVRSKSWRLRKVWSGISRTYSSMLRLPHYYSIIDFYLWYSNLNTIKKELDKIASQAPWKLVLYSDLNTSAVNACLDRLSIALEKFKVVLTSDTHCFAVDSSLSPEIGRASCRERV